MFKKLLMFDILRNFRRFLVVKVIAFSEKRKLFLEDLTWSGLFIICTSFYAADRRDGADRHLRRGRRDADDRASHRRRRDLAARVSATRSAVCAVRVMLRVRRGTRGLECRDADAARLAVDCDACVASGA